MMEMRYGSRVSPSAVAVIAAPRVAEQPATCRRCGHVFKSYVIRTIDGQQQLFDLDGNLIYEIELVCRFCETVYPWHSSWKAMERNTRAWKKLEASLRRMHDHQAELDAENKDGGPSSV